MNFKRRTINKSFIFIGYAISAMD